MSEPCPILCPKCEREITKLDGFRIKHAGTPYSRKEHVECPPPVVADPLAAENPIADMRTESPALME